MRETCVRETYSIWSREQMGKQIICGVTLISSLKRRKAVYWIAQPADTVAATWRRRFVLMSGSLFLISLKWRQSDTGYFRTRHQSLLSTVERWERRLVSKTMEDTRSFHSAISIIPCIVLAKTNRRHWWSVEHFCATDWRMIDLLKLQKLSASNSDFFPIT